MTKFKKYFLYLLPIFVLFFSTAGSAHALEMKNYIPLPGVLTPSADCKVDCLSILVSYWVEFFIYIAGIISLISFTIGAIGYIVSVDSTEGKSNARDRMKGAVLGLVLTLSSFIIAKTININLVTPTLSPPPGVSGIFYTDGTNRAPVGMSVDDVNKRGDDLIKNGFDQLTYCCSEDCKSTGDENSPVLLVWKFNKPGLEGGNDLNSDVRVERLTCSQKTSIGSGSFKMNWEHSGIYYCLGGCGGSSCSGYMSDFNTSSQDDLGDTFRGKIKGAYIVNDSKNDVYYGSIFHGTIGLKNGGICTEPLINDSDRSSCKAVNISASAVDIFKLNKKNNNGFDSGTGITFYSRPYGQAVNNLGHKQAGFYEVKNPDIKSPYLQKNTDEMKYDYDGVDAPAEYQHKCNGSYPHVKDSSGQDVKGPDGSYVFAGCSDTACETFQDCPGYIDIKGQYLVGVYSQNVLLDNPLGSNNSNSSNGEYCQTFTNTVPDLNEYGIIQNGATKTKSVYIIPTQ